MALSHLYLCIVWLICGCPWVTLAATGERTVERTIRSIRSGGDPTSIGGATMDPPTTATTTDAATSADAGMETQQTRNLDVVFSDLDGTLLHYPDHVGASHKTTKDMVQLPPSSTGMVGILSAQTLVQCRQIRNSGIPFVLVSGMRMETMWKRLPYLPRADAYCCEAGGRIFYPTTSSSGKGSGVVQPQPFPGAQPSNLEPFGLQEDLEWRSKMERDDAAGKDGYIGNHNVAGEDAATTSGTIPLDLRKGALWEHARTLIAQHNVVPDTKGYSTCFRVNRKHQKDDTLFDKLLQGQILPCPSTLATSTNLGCVDFYPSTSGKRNCCAYLARKFSSTVAADNEDDPLSTRCVCLCDDDNDIEMALACLHAYIPTTSSDSIVETIRKYPTKFTLTAPGGDEGITQGTERALALILDRIRDGGPS